MELGIIIVASLVAGAAWSSPLRGLLMAVIRPVLSRFRADSSGHDRILRFSAAAGASASQGTVTTPQPSVSAIAADEAATDDAGEPAGAPPLSDERPASIDMYRGDDRPAVWRVGSPSEAGHLRSAIAVGDVWVRLDGELGWETSAARRRLLARAVADHPRWTDREIDDVARRLGVSVEDAGDSPPASGRPASAV